jgi:hypothetical protein
VVEGYFRYYAVPTNLFRLDGFRRSLPHLAACAEATQPTNPVELGSFQSNSPPVHTAVPQAPSIPGRAILRVTYLRQEPYAVVPLVRIRAGGDQ